MFFTLCSTPGALERTGHRTCPWDTCALMRTQLHNHCGGRFGRERGRAWDQGESSRLAPGKDDT